MSVPRLPFVFAVVLLVVLWIVGALTAFGKPSRDLRLPDDGYREVAGVIHDTAHGAYVLVAVTGERCSITATDYARAHVGEYWGCRWTH